jgi:hypothetical protein
MREIIFIILFLLLYSFISNEDYLIKLSDEKKYCHEMSSGTFVPTENIESCKNALEEKK